MSKMWPLLCLGCSKPECGTGTVDSVTGRMWLTHAGMLGTAMSWFTLLAPRSEDLRAITLGRVGTIPAAEGRQTCKKASRSGKCDEWSDGAG